MLHSHIALYQNSNLEIITTRNKLHLRKMIFWTKTISNLLCQPPGVRNNHAPITALPSICLMLSRKMCYWVQSLCKGWFTGTVLPAIKHHVAQNDSGSIKSSTNSSNGVCLPWLSIQNRWLTWVVSLQIGVGWLGAVLWVDANGYELKFHEEKVTTKCAYDTGPDEFTKWGK